MAGATIPTRIRFRVCLPVRGRCRWWHSRPARTWRVSPLPALARMQFLHRVKSSPQRSGHSGRGACRAAFGGVSGGGCRRIPLHDRR
jgi:hypothetical protein